MNPQKIEFQRYRDFGQIINATFEFLRENFKQLAKAVIYLVGPFILLTGIFGGLYQKDLFSFTSTIKSLSEFGIAFGLYIFFAILTSLVLVSTVYSYILLYLKRQDDIPIEVDEVWLMVKSKTLKILLFSIGYGLVTVFATILLIIPGIYVSVSLMIIYIVGLNEDKGFFDSMSRSFFLIKNKWWFTFGLLLVLSLIQGFLGFLFQIPQYIAMFVVAFNSAEGNATSSTTEIIFIVTTIISSLNFIFYSISLIGIAFHYFSLVEQKEAKGLLDKIESI
ncbi:MAG: hypothetical protein EHM44_03045 [Ignavibacteriales bacterium]|nr:MAG: hypothetical protein EHM44_03045 [Ignavibacteriales bacterium]